MSERGEENNGFPIHSTISMYRECEEGKRLWNTSNQCEANVSGNIIHARVPTKRVRPCWAPTIGLRTVAVLLVLALGGVAPGRT